MRDFGPECEVLSPCKLNPCLRILGRRADGMHEVLTTLLALDHCDLVRLRRHAIGPGQAVLGLSAGGPAYSPDIPLDETNLAWRGAQLVLDLALERGLELRGEGFALHIEKHVPSRAGLGGGSSNAAAAALGMAQLLQLDCDDPQLGERLAFLGADVAFFWLARRTGWALCTGRGELVQELEPAPQDGRVFVVWTPRETCSTAEVYAALSESERRAAPGSDALDAWLRLPVAAARLAACNDLEAAALRSHPELLKLRMALESAGPGVVGLCGSGSSFYGMFDSHEAAEAFLAQRSMARIERDFGLRAQFIARARGRGVG